VIHNRKLILQDSDVNTQWNPVVQIHDVLIEQANAPARNGAAYGLWLVCAV
jgi:hypothetical protein